MEATCSRACTAASKIQGFESCCLHFRSIDGSYAIQVTITVMEIVYVYTKKRAEFGRQPLFTDCGAQLNVDIEPDNTVKDDFIERNPVDMALQYAPEMSEHEVRNT